MNLKINGVYDLNTIRHLKILNVNDFVFDFRPRSLNFIQIQKVYEILNQLSPINTNIFFRFEDEKNYVVEHTLNVLNEHLKSSWNYSLCFSGLAIFESYESHSTPYYWAYTELVELPKEPLKYLKGIVFDYTFLEQQMQFGNLFDLIKKIKSSFGETIQLEFISNWNQPIMETITDFIDFKFNNFEINSDVELSFRNIDLNSLNKYIEPQKIISKQGK